MINIGPITLYGLRTAMHGAINIKTRWGFLCFKTPTKVFGRWWPAYLYLSPNATPWASTMLFGRGFSRREKRQARYRRLVWGHGYRTREYDPQEARNYPHFWRDDFTPAEEAAATAAKETVR